MSFSTRPHQRAIRLVTRPTMIRSLVLTCRDPSQLRDNITELSRAFEDGALPDVRPYDRPLHVYGLIEETDRLAFREALHAATPCGPALDATRFRERRRFTDIRSCGPYRPT